MRDPVRELGSAQISGIASGAVPERAAVDSLAGVP